MQSELDGKSDGAEKIFAYLERHGITREEAVTPRERREDVGGDTQKLVLAFFPTEDGADEAAKALKKPPAPGAPGMPDAPGMQGMSGMHDGTTAAQAISAGMMTDQQMRDRIALTPTRGTPPTRGTGATDATVGRSTTTLSDPRSPTRVEDH